MALPPSKISWQLTLWLLIIILQLSGCRGSDPELQRNEKLWQESKIANYNFVIMRYQGGMYSWAPVLVQVRDGRAISAQPIEEVGELVKVDYEDYDTIEKIFAKIQESYRKGDSVTVIYNKALGYPENVKIDPKKGVDALFTIELSKFESIK